MAKSSRFLVESFSLNCNFIPTTSRVEYEVILNYEEDRTVRFNTFVKLGEPSKALDQFLDQLDSLVHHDVFVNIATLMSDYLKDLRLKSLDIQQSAEEKVKAAVAGYSEGKIPLDEFFDKLFGKL